MESPLPPSLPPSLIGGHFFKFRRDPTGFLTDLAQLGDVTRLSFFGKETVFLNHPDLIRDLLITHNSKFKKGIALQMARHLLGDGLLTSHGELHRKRRRMIQPAFHHARIADYSRSMTYFASQRSDSWIDGETLDIDSEMKSLTLAIVGKTLFNANVGEEAEEIRDSMEKLMSLFGYLLIPFSEQFAKLPYGPARKAGNAIARLDRVIYRIIERRKRKRTDEGDLLSMLLLARDEESGEYLEDVDLRDEILTLFVAGYETTASALIFVWYLLFLNPEFEKDLHGELAAVLEGRTPGIEDIPDLKVTKSVVAETMRLFPPAWAMGRIALEEHEFDGYNIPVDGSVLICPYTIHRDERFWDRPDSFLPSRWESKSVKDAGREFVYLPFSRGVRNCIGEHFAWTELILVVATLAQNWSLRLDPNQVFKLDPLMTLQPKYGLKMRVESRQ